VVQVAAGGTHTIGLTDTGRMFIWGRASYGRLGLEGRKDAYGPEECQLPGGTERWKIAAIACGGRHSMCLAVPVRDNAGNGNSTSTAVAAATASAAAAAGGGGGYSNGVGMIANGVSRVSTWFSGGAPAAAAAAGAPGAGGLAHSTSTGSMASLHQQQQHQQQQVGCVTGGNGSAAASGLPLRRSGSTGASLPPMSPPNKQQQQQGQSQQQQVRFPNIEPVGGLGAAASVGRYQSGSMGGAAGGSDGSLKGNGSGSMAQGEELRSISRPPSAANLADGEAVSGV
jgi:hypothetical protein